MKCKTILTGFLFFMCVFSFGIIGHAQTANDDVIAMIMNANVIDSIQLPAIEKVNEKDIEITGSVISGSVNVRSGPGLNYEVIGTVRKGEQLSLSKYHSDGWYEFDLNDKKGWIYAWFIRVENEPVCMGTVVNGDVNLREAYDTSAEVIIILNEGFEVSVHGRHEEWYYIEYKGFTGWVMGKYIQTSYKEKGLLIINANQVNIRVYPDLGAAVAMMANKNDIFVTYGEYDGWYRILLRDGNHAWIKSEFADYIPYLIDNTPEDYQALSVLEPPSRWDGMKLIQQLIINTAKKYMGVPYVWGGESPRGFDCSGFTLYVYKDFGVRMAHFAATQATYGKYVPIGSLKPGDLVFFDGSGGGAITHVGIYIGDNQFIHASSSTSQGKYVRISELTGYYRNTYITARRIFDY